MWKHLFLLLTYFLISNSGYTQQYEFSHISNTDGLSNNQVECIFKDSRGFMWFATNIGLNRYDGSAFRIYKYVRNDPSGLSYDRFTDIMEDYSGNLWLSANNANYLIYDWKTERFSSADTFISGLDLPVQPAIVEIDAEKNYYFYYIGKGIYKYEPQSQKTTFFEISDNAESLSKTEILAIRTHNEYLWVLHTDGLLERINQKTNKVDMRETFIKNDFAKSTIKKSFYIDADNDVWVYPGRADRGVMHMDVRKGKWNILDTDSKPALSNNFVRQVCQDKDGIIWIGADHGGVNIYNKKTQQITVLKNNIHNRNSISQNSVISLFCEDNGTVWVGTYKNGVSYYHPNLFKFKKSPLYNIFSQNAEIFDCNSLYKDTNDNLWIGTNGRGLVRYNTVTEDVQIFRHNMNNPASISSDIITSLFTDHTQTLWIGTFLGGLNTFDGKSFKRYQINEGDTNSISAKSVYGVAEDNENNLWIATLGGGIDKLDATRTHFTNFNMANTSTLFADYVLSVFTDAEKNIYFSSNAGINIIDKDKKQVDRYFKKSILLDSLANAASNYVLVDSRKLLWIATDNGVYIYNPYTELFTNISSLNGMPSDEVVSLVEDTNGNIWAGTRNGLVCIYCTYENNRIDYTLAYFDIKDGMPSSVCNQNAVFRDTEGIIYVGTTNGYVSFNPNNIVFNKEPPKPRFTDLLIASQVIKPNEEYNGRIIINRSITDLDAITLNHGETNFTVQFSALNFIHPEKNRYRYMLEGLDNKWTEITNGWGAASYSNLNSGTYKLIVYAGNDDNVWNEQPITLKITVKPPFWFSWWAFLLYLLIIGAILRWIMKYKLNKQREEYEQAQQILEANKIHEVDELKFKFFTNISHEFKTPLTLIITPLEKLLKSQVSEDQKATLNIMYKNALNLLNMVNEILDFRKFDLNKMALHISRGNIISFTKDICQSFSSLAAEKSIRLTFTTYLEELQMEFDREKMNKIITNLISNAFKYTDEGHIDISIGVSELLQQDDKKAVKQLSLKVSDTGIGIEPEYMDKIFERFFRVENSENKQGTGVGLHLVSEYIKLHGGEIQVESTVGKGSVFTVLLPIHNSTYKELSTQDIIHSGESVTEEKQPTAEQQQKIAQRANLPLLLIVDDNEDFCEFITSLFVDDYRIVTANDGEEGVRIVFDQLPDIILCDVMMPKTDGYEFCRQVKGDIRTSHIPIILLTAKSSEENKYSGIEAGADDYISKPFNIDMLRLKIAKIIEKQKLLQKNFKKKIDISPSEIEITSMDEKFVQKSIAIVEQNIGNTEFLVEDLCKEMGMSRVYFYKKILALTDKSPSEFIRFIRLKRAADLLEKSQMYVNEIAFQVGFNDPKYFRKYFKEEFGLTPNDYKKKASGEG